MSEPLIDYDLYPSESAYGYRPTEWVCITFIVIFSLLAFAHTVQGFMSKYWIVYPTLVLGTIGEIIGWSGRLWSNRNLNLDTPFMMQIASLIISPVFYSAFNYTMLGKAVEKINPTYCMLTSKMFVGIFLTADIISLVLQAIGGGWAASSDPPVPDAASNLMLAGIAFQLAIMIIFVLIGIDYCFRVATHRPYGVRVNKLSAGSNNTSTGENLEMGQVSSSRRTSETHIKGAGIGANGETWEGMSKGWWLLMLAMLISSLAIIVRGIYRTAELSQGWDGELIEDETLQNVLDGIMMVIAVGIFNVLHPGFLLPKRYSWRGVL